MNIFYISLKNHIKNEITRGDKPNELAKMIKTIIYINNRVYKW
jgi:hypothetical protein